MFGLIQLLLSDHEGRIDRRDWIGLLAGLAGLMSSAVGVPLVMVVGATTLIRRGWRVAFFHTAPLAAIYTTWWIGIAQRHYRAPNTTAHLDLLTRWVATGISASFDAIGQLPGVGIALGVLLIAGLVLAWGRLDRREVREVAIAPAALLVGGVIFLVISGWARATEHTPRIETEGGHYLHILVAMAVPAIAVAAAPIARRWRVLMPIVAALLVVGIPGNLQALANPGPLLRPDFQIAYPQSILSLVSVPTAYYVPRKIRPDDIIGVFQPGTQYEVNIGWLLDEKQAGRVPTLGPKDLQVMGLDKFPTTEADVSRLLANATLHFAVQRSNSYLGAQVATSAPAPGSAAPTAVGAAQSASSAPVVMTAHNSKLGTILVDSHGMTLYTLIKAFHPLPCTGACGRVWPQLVLPAGMTTPTGGPRVTGLGRAGSHRQVTDWGFPLYSFSGDKIPGAVTGNNIMSDGGVWRAIALAPPRTCSPLTTPVVQRLHKGDSIVVSGGPVGITYLAGPTRSDVMTFNPIKGNTLRAAAGPLTLRLAPTHAGDRVTVCR